MHCWESPGTPLGEGYEMQIDHDAQTG
jgi:hypothetical protein